MLLLRWIEAVFFFTKARKKVPPDESNAESTSESQLKDKTIEGLSVGSG